MDKIITRATDIERETASSHWTNYDVVSFTDDAEEEMTKEISNNNLPNSKPTSR